MLERTCCSLVWVAHRLRHYMLYFTTYLISRMDPIKYIFEKPTLTGRISRWHMLLTEFDIIYVSQKAIKGQAIADLLADCPVEDYYPMNTIFPEEAVLSATKEEDELAEPLYKGWRLYFDGASNQAGTGIGAVIVSEGGIHHPIVTKLKFDCTNNMAEYEACIIGLRAALDMGIKDITVFGDSDLIIQQTRGDWQTRDFKLIPYHKYMIWMIQLFRFIEFRHIPRTQNHFADALATLAAMVLFEDGMEIPPIIIDVSLSPTYCLAIEDEPDDLPWYYDIKRFLQNQEYPAGSTQASTLIFSKW